MNDPTPNPEQRRFIEHTDGLYLVDAGAGTGKTLAVTRRYANLIDRPDVEPDDVLLVTFTRSAANEMRERIVDRSGYGLRELADAPIRTFHAHAHHILDTHGFAAPTHLGIDDRITGSTRLIDDELVEGAHFREFIGRFRDAHPEYADQFRAVDRPLELLDLIKQLSAKGVIPTREGWYRDAEANLDGDFAAFERRFAEVNRPRNGGSKQSRLRSDLVRYGKNKTYLPDAPSRSAIRSAGGAKQIEPALAERVFEEDRSALKAFVHDVFFEYLAFALDRNYLTFGLLQLFAYVLLLEDHDLRDRLSFEYVMVDEFQDTSEIQFELTLLLAGTNNIAVVGDWKQSIYSFQYADVANITEFEDRLERFAAALNDDATRVAFDTGPVTRIELAENYRSTQTLLDVSEQALVTPATDEETVDTSVLDDVVSLSSNSPFGDTTVEAIQHEDEYEAVLAKLQDIVGNEAYPVEDEDGNPRPPDYGDVAVLTRTRDYGRELLEHAAEYDVPMAYDGGVELFRSDRAKLLLAWLRILETDADRGWAVVLERAGYTLEEIEHRLSNGRYPTNLNEFRRELAEVESLASVARRVFDRYGYHGDYADVILDTVQSVHDATTMRRGDLIRFIARAIENGSTTEVHTSAGEDSVTVQTIHAAKGLEYPIVVLANMNEGRFPPRTRDSKAIRYEESVGIRQRTEYSERGPYPHVYDNWRYDVLRHCLPDGYDEERRLLYVAITRARHHLIVAGGQMPNAFLDGLPVEVESIVPEVVSVERDETTQARLPFTISPREGPIGLTPHDLMDDSVFDAGLDGTESRNENGVEGGLGFGSRVHDFAERYARGEAETPSNADERHVVEYVDSLSGTSYVEEPVVLPIAVGDRRVTISGVVDLLTVTDDRVEVVDYKTDQHRGAVSEYTVQLSVYYHVLDSVFPDKTVEPSLFFTREGDRIPIEPRSMADLGERVRGCLDDKS